MSLASLAGAQDQVAAHVEVARHIPGWWYIAPAGAVAALLFAFYFYTSIMKESEGTPAMKQIASYVREGAYAYLRRQYVVVGAFFGVVALLLAFMAFGLELQNKVVPFAFLTGGFFSGLAGFLGMKTATASSARTAFAASKSLDKGLRVAFRAGAVMGLTVVGLALADITVWFLYLYLYHHQLFGIEPLNLETITVVMLCFGMGASSQALFARVGGGIYTKAADVGADLVGKVEAGIPEDDPRNPATIADNVGDNVGDVAGMGADLYESYAGSILATAALGVAAASTNGWAEEVAFNYLAAPMLIAACGIVLSIIGIFLVRARENASMLELLGALNRGIYVASALVLVASYFVISGLGLPFSAFLSIVIGLVLGLVIGKGTEWATASEYAPTQRIANNAKTGPATVIISGIAEGMLSTWLPILAVCVGMILAFSLSGGSKDVFAGLYGVSIAAVGMLSTLGITLATDAYGPIADNAGGIAEMAEMPKEVRHRTDALDSLGNTTAAIGKGFAIGSAALTALALLASYIEEVRIGLHREVATAYVAPAPGDDYMVKDLGYGKFGIYIPGADDTMNGRLSHTFSAIHVNGDHAVWVTVDEGATKGEVVPVIVNEMGNKARASKLSVYTTQGQEADAMRSLSATKATLDDYMTFYKVTLMNPSVLAGCFVGVLLVFVFSALTMQAVGRAAAAMVDEVRRQFREFPGIMLGTQKPDYARCVAISTAGAQREMVLPSMLAVAIPVGVGLVLNVAGVMGLLVGGLTSGFAVAVFMANSGGAWDNAKKYVEAGNLGGKGSDAHKATVVGDTVGDPFKDTSGPSLNILIKLTSMVSIVFAGLIVKFAPIIGAWLGLS
ncbi:sodium-translocating pyrophosphatase [bacterium]|nr:sodium-translocating pyrophosphatase [bacterium]